MALVAYSDESDMSENEEIDPPPELNYSKNLSTAYSPNDKTTNISENSKTYSLSRVTENNGQKLGLLSSIPQPHDGNLSHSDVSSEADIVDDVPTAKTWNPKTILPIVQNKKGNIVDNKGKKNKLKLILPALSEFDDDEVEELAASPKTKMKPSTSGTGLFAVLPKPRSTGLLIPNHVSRKTESIQSKKKFKTEETNSHKRTPAKIIDSDDEGETLKASDFFSLSSQEKESESLSEFPSLIKSSIKPSNVDDFGSQSVISYQTREVLQEPVQSLYSEQVGPNLESPMIIPPADIDEEALKRLGGRRNKEIPNIVDVNADDALMNREEWMNKVLTEEKPQMSYSKKKEGMPSQVQKRKHQITYLAHQAKEREQELMQSWGQNRLTKKQTQSKYGF